MKHAPRRRRNVERQERLVKALWDFASRIQAMKPGEHDVKAEDGTRLKLKDVGDAMTEIMDTFGYDVTEIQ